MVSLERCISSKNMEIFSKFLFLFADEKPKIRFTDSKVCRTFLVGCCPHDILDSTVTICFGRIEKWMTYIFFTFSANGHRKMSKSAWFRCKGWLRKSQQRKGVQFWRWCNYREKKLKCRNSYLNFFSGALWTSGFYSWLWQKNRQRKKRSCWNSRRTKHRSGSEGK